MRDLVEKIETGLSAILFAVTCVLVFVVVLPVFTFGEITFLQIFFGLMMSLYLWLCLMIVFFPIWSLIKKFVFRERRKSNV